MGTKAPTKHEGQQEYIDKIKAGAEAAYRRGVHQTLAWAAEHWSAAQIAQAFQIAHDFRHDGEEHRLLLDDINTRLQQEIPRYFGNR
jgi:ATP:corrinoid adenosyltransferase